MLLVSQEVVWVVVAVVVDVVVVAMVAAAVESFFFCASRSFCQARFMATRGDADPSMQLVF